MVSVPPVNESGPEKAVVCTWPVAEVFKRPFEIPDTQSAVVEAIPVESDVVVAPVAVMFWKLLVPVKVLVV
jgi:hypothetical protein